MKQQDIKRIAGEIWQVSGRNWHNRLVTGGLLVALCYFPGRLLDLINATVRGMPSLITAMAVLLGLYLLWEQRQQLKLMQAEEADQLLGHLLLISGILLGPFCFAAEWTQRLNLMLILSGIACSTWGGNFFWKYPIPVFLIVLGLFPEPFNVGQAVWETFTPPRMLEQFMAWTGSWGLRLIGQPAIVEGTFIHLPGGSVDVQWRCAGFDMAVTLAVASLVLAIFLKQSWPRVVLLVAIGVVLALIGNIPRIMLLAVSEAYWGKAAFDFWHGVWGGQIFSTAMFTIYYYAVMGLTKQKSKKAGLNINQKSS